jgi:hypothetical protein
MDDQGTDRDGGEGVKPQQVFSSDYDVLPDDAPIPLRPINRLLLGLFGLKIGCILVWFLLILFVCLVVKFSGGFDVKRDVP